MTRSDGVVAEVQHAAGARVSVDAQLSAILSRATAAALDDSYFLFF